MSKRERIRACSAPRRHTGGDPELESLQSGEIASDQRFLLPDSPTLQLTLTSDGAVRRIVLFRVDETDRTSGGRVLSSVSGIVNSLS
jgi:hypothetical protein